MTSTAEVAPSAPGSSVATAVSTSKTFLAVEDGASDTHAQQAAAARRKRLVIIGSAAAVLVIVAIIVAVVVVKKNGSASSDSSSSAAAHTATGAGSSSPAAPTSANGTSLFAANALTWGGNNERNKVYPNSGLDPATVASSAFGRRATIRLPLSDPVTANGTDSVYAQPIVFSKDGTEYALIVTTGNNIYVVDGMKGTVVTAKNFGAPHRILEDPVFIKAQLDKDQQSAGTMNEGVCRDIVDFVGTVGTPVIDPTTNTAYFFSINVKPFPDQNTRSMLFHAVDSITLAERDGFPVTIAPAANNNPAMKFDPNLTYQRPGLLLSDGIVYGTFGGHCDLNQGFAGWLIGVDGKTGEILTAWSTVGISDIANGGGAIWQSGAAPALDEDGYIHLVTGTGLNPGSTSFYNDAPATKSNIPVNLHESYVKFAVDPVKRQAKVVDFMTPAKVQYYDFQDFDYGAGAPVILPASLRGPNGERLTCTMDKPGRSLIHKINDLGGYAGGTTTSPNTDQVLGLFDLGEYINSTMGVYQGYFGTPTVWTGEPDTTYFYYAVKYGPVVAMTWNPTTYSFDKVVGQSSFTFSKRTDNMNSIPGLTVVTSDGNKSGSAVVWVTDVFNGLYALNGVPENGNLKTLYHDDSFVGGQISRFNIPGFSQAGSGLVYVPTNNGTLLIYGKTN